MSKHTPGPWAVVMETDIGVEGPFVVGNGNENEDICDLFTHAIQNEHGQHSGIKPYPNAKANANLIAASPCMHDQLKALVLYGWTVEKVSLYDEEGVEGWMWTEPDGTEHTEAGEWGDLPPWPMSARDAMSRNND